MSNPFVEKEVLKIVQDKSLEFPKNVSLAAAWIIANFKGINLKIIDVKETSSLCDYNILATSENTIQAKTMVSELIANLKQHGLEVLSIEGLTDGEWILLDLGDIIIHIFQENARDIFDLDGLWQSYDQVTIPSDYYFAHPETKTQDDTTGHYF